MEWPLSRAEFKDQFLTFLLLGVKKVQKIPCAIITHCPGNGGLESPLSENIVLIYTHSQLFSQITKEEKTTYMLVNI